MDRFLDNAARILEGGRSAAQADCNTQTAWTVILDSRGAVRMIADSDWPLDSLARENGATMAYRVSQSGSHVKVDGIAQGRRCALETEKPANVAKWLLSDRRQYLLGS